MAFGYAPQGSSGMSYCNQSIAQCSHASVGLAQARPNNSLIPRSSLPPTVIYKTTGMQRMPGEDRSRNNKCLVTSPSTFDVEWSFLQSVRTCLSQSFNFISVFTCIFTYTINHVVPLISDFESCDRLLGLIRWK